MTEYIEIKITQGNINNDSLRFPKSDSFFPADSWGGSNKNSPGKAIDVGFRGTSELVSTDIDGKKRIFRHTRGELQRFYKRHNLKAGDHVFIIKKGERDFEVSNTKPVVPQGEEGVSEASEDNKNGRKDVLVSRVIRDTKVARGVKSLYGNSCQVCNQVIPTAHGTYSEGCHIRPLGEPHNGPDVAGNILCLCPNHHVMLDRGALFINDDLSLSGTAGALTMHADHKLDLDCVRYHRNIKYA